MHVYTPEEVARLQSLNIIPKDAAADDVDEIFRFTNNPDPDDEDDNFVDNFDDI